MMMSRPLRFNTLIPAVFVALVTLYAASPAYGLGDVPCPGDLDGDYDIDLADLSRLLGNYGISEGASYEDGDLDGDGDVDLSDLGALLAVYGTTCPAPGDSCENPIEVTFGAGWPAYADTNTTCGRGNYYDDTCLDPYDGGEDIVYELTVLSSVDVQITLDPMETGWTGLAIDETCPPGESCIAYATEGAQGSPTISFLHLEPGTYYIIVDTWPLPDCIPEFTLTIEEVFGEWVTCPPDGIPENEPCGDDTNGGCRLEPPQFEPMACMETICGTLWAEDGWRDTEWFEVVATEPTSFVWTAQAEFPVIIGLVETDPPGSGDCSDMTGYLDPWDMAGAVPDMAEITTEMLPPGVYWFWIAPEDFYGLPCSSMSDYVVTLECSLAP
jgi:hypothetical protein